MYKNISKKILSFLFVFTLFFISLNSVKAVSTTIMTNNVRLTDFIKPGVNSYTTRFWAWNNGDPALSSTTDGANAFCLDPNNRAPSGLNGSAGTVQQMSVSAVDYNSSNPGVNDAVRKLLYYGIGGPRWASASTHWYNITCGGNICPDSVYALEHLFLSNVDGSCNAGNCTNYEFSS